MSAGRERPSEAASRQAFEAVLGRVQNPARLVGGENGAGAGFDPGHEETRVALAFPDSYEVGISNQAVQILYHLARGVAGVGVERVYLPWVDAIAELRAGGIPLMTLETWTPVRNTHVLGVTLQHELNYTNLLELLDLSGIAVGSADRGEGDPLVVAGGPATANFWPVARFVDAFVLGDGEEAFVEVVEAVRDGRESGLARIGLKTRLADLPGVFVPGVSTKVDRRVLPSMRDAPFPEACLVPLTAGVHDRAWVEVMRGCTRGCRFCQAGMWYRPVRERSAREVVDLAGRELTATGHEELSLGSLSTTDYSGIEEVLERLAREHPQVRVNLPSLRVDSAAVRLGHLTSPTSSSVTLAPEAGSQRLRDVVNKNVSEADILDAAREAFGSGHSTLKLYFMIGLPTETDDDVEAIVTLVGRIRALGRAALGSKAGRLQLKVSVTNFIPKPFTPFQWAAMAGRETLARRQQILLRGLRPFKVRPALHDITWSYVEAVLARGGGDIGVVVEQAWRGGARFDSWTDQRRLEAWEAAFANGESNPEAVATTPLDLDAPLPWDVVEGSVVSRAFLESEWRRALSGQTTVDCRWEGCYDCGACGTALLPDLAGALTSEAHATATGTGSPPEPAQRVVRGGSLSYLLGFAVGGRGVYLGHLDTVEVLRRAVRRAGGRLALSAGLRPKAQLAVVLPRAVGVSSAVELCQFTLAAFPSDDFVERLAAALPPGFSLVSLTSYHNRRAAAARVAGVRYRAIALLPAGQPDALSVVDREALDDAARRYTCSEEMVVERIRLGQRRSVDVRAYVEQFSAEPIPAGIRLDFRARVTPLGTARPEEVVRVLGLLLGMELVVGSVERTAIDLV